MRYFKWAGLANGALLSAALSACGANQGAQDSALDGVPEQASFELTATGDVASEALATDADSVDPASSVAEALGQASSAIAASPAPELARAQGAVRQLNQALRAFMQPIVALVRDNQPSSIDGNLRVYGPVTRGATEYRFVLRHGLVRHYGWLLQGRPAGSSDEFTNVAAGGITVGFAARRGTGTIGLDLDALGSVDPTVVARGQLFAGFAQLAAGSSLSYRLHAFSADPTGMPPVDARLRGVHWATGYNRLRLAFYGNLEGTATDAPELVLSRVRQRTGVGGRADALVTGGDIADGRLWVVNECWSAGLASAYRLVRDCPGDGIGGARCTIVSSSGDVAACAPAFATAELPPQDPLTDMPDSDSPADEVPAPDAMPDGTPPNQ